MNRLFSDKLHINRVQLYGVLCLYKVKSFLINFLFIHSCIVSQFLQTEWNFSHFRRRKRESTLENKNHCIFLTNRKMSQRQICSRSAWHAASFHKTPHLWHKRPVVHAHAVTLHKICASLDRAENKLVAIRHVRSWRYARCHLTWFPSARSAARRPSQLQCLACFFRDKSLSCDREIIREINKTGAARSKQTHVSSMRKRNRIRSFTIYIVSL